MIEPVRQWVDRIRPHLTQTVESIIAAGRELADAKAALPHGQFGPLLDELGLSPQHAQKFMRVAAHPVLSNASPGRHLPGSISTLDALTRWDPDELADAIDAGEITPATTRAQAEAKRKPAPEPESLPEPPPLPPELADAIRAAQADRSNAAPSNSRRPRFENDDTPSVSARSRPSLTEEELIAREIDEADERTRDRLRQAVIGWISIVSLPTNDRRDVILAGLIDHDREKVLEIEAVYVHWKASHA